MHREPGLRKEFRLHFSRMSKSTRYRGQVTRRLFEHALNHKELLYDSRSGIRSVSLDWNLTPPKAAASEQMALFD